ncbi:hypothetical protein P5673_004090, partial [Acropora cervicornis]
MEWETHHDLPFLNVLINNTDPHLTLTPVYLKRTFPEPSNINNTWMGFHRDLQKVSVSLQKNPFPENLINNCINRLYPDCSPGVKDAVPEEILTCV